MKEKQFIDLNEKYYQTISNLKIPTKNIVAMLFSITFTNLIHTIGDENAVKVINDTLKTLQNASDRIRR